MPVTITTNQEGPVFGTTSTQITQLANLLSTLPQNIVLDAGEFVGRGTFEAAQFVQNGGIWVSYAGYPFYYGAKAGPTYGGNGVTAFLQALNVQAPSGMNFFTPSGANRALVTTTNSLPTNWVSGESSITKGSVYEWPMIGVQVGKGWWFYASGDIGDVTPDVYATFISTTINPPIIGAPSTPTNPSKPIMKTHTNLQMVQELIPTLVAGAAIVVAAIVNR